MHDKDTTNASLRSMIDYIQCSVISGTPNEQRARRQRALQRLREMPSPGLAPSGPRMRGEGCDEDEQGVVSAEMTGEGSAKLRITLLAAGFVIGPSGASVREITHRTGSSIRSWNENVKVRGKDRKVRTLIIEGPPCSIQMALQIISGAVARYKDLCEGAFCGQAVDRVQVIGSVDFMYQPPPRHAVPFAASLRADSDSMARGWNRKHPRSPISPAGNKENLQAGDAGAFKCSIKNPGWAALVPGCGLPPVKEPSPPPPMPATPLFDSQLCMPEQYPWSMLQASAHLAALGRACEDGNVAPSARCQDVTPMRLDFGLGAHSAAETGPWDASLLLSSKPCPDVRAPHSRTQAPAFSLFGPLTGYEGQHLANLSHGSPPSGPTAQSVLAAQLDALNRQFSFNQNMDGMHLPQTAELAMPTPLLSEHVSHFPGWM
uniref:K Homology domain-containing protein n=1 Tax=Auxenochlorella protothecoides TaxID=3075 RepID=A0A1D1ZZG8_AUXPR